MATTIPSMTQEALATRPTALRATITQRWTPCRCGCGGRDSQHAAKVTRTVRAIVWLTPHGPFLLGEKVMLAEGRYSHPSGERVCYLVGTAREAGGFGCLTWVGARALPRGWEPPEERDARVAAEAQSAACDAHDD